MARDFTSASSTRIDLSTALGNWEYTQAFSVAAYVRTKTNVSSGILGKMEGSGNFRGWCATTRAGSLSPTFQVDIRNGASNEVNIRTTAEFSTGTFRHVVWTYDGSGLVAGVHIYVDGVDQALTTINNTLAGATILNSVEAQIGCRGGIGAPAFFANAILRRVLLYNVLLSSTDVTNLYDNGNGGYRPTRISGLQLWQEFGALNDGATLVPDWSENNNWGAVTTATYSATDPSIATVPPDLGLTGARTLSGPLTKNAGNPILTNQGYASGGTLPTGTAGDQIGPGVIYKAGAGDYRGWFENNVGLKSLDVGNQPGAFDWDTPTLYGTSADGTTWSLVNQGVPASAIFNCLNVGGNSTFKTTVQGETSISSLFFDPDDGVWKAWFHGGNNSGTRSIYLATCSGDPTGANWTVANSGVAVLTPSVSGWDALYVSDGRVIRVSNSLMLMLYRGVSATSAVRIGLATSTDRGLTWTKSGSNPVLNVGAAGAWDAGDVYPGGFIYDEPLNLYLCWYGAGRTAGGGNVDGIGFASSPDGTTWTKGVFNPVLCKNTTTSGGTNFEDLIAATVSAYLDGRTYRIWYRADNGASGTTGFRGRAEASIAQQSGFLPVSN